jgi:hypothetical protein
VVAECTASDEELKARGPDACPAATKLTVGEFTGITGFGPPADPFVGDDHVFNGPRQLIEVITFHGSSASPGFDRLTVDGSTLTAHPPKAAGAPPDNEASVRSIDFRIPVRVAAGRSLMTTPPTCPDDGAWASVATFGFADGSSETVTSRTPCRPPSQAAGAPPPPAAARAALAVTVRPRRVRAGRLVRIRVHATSADAGCVAGATVRVGSRAVRTDGRGRATLPWTFKGPGTRHALVTKRGCRGARAVIRVARGRRAPHQGAGS